MPHIHELKDFVVSTFILHPSEPKFLLLKHRKLGKWLQPGGHVELNENPLGALEHEILEETGLTTSDYDFVDQPEQPNVRGCERIPLPFFFNEHSFADTNHSHIDLCYLLRAKTEKLTENPDGADDIDWFTLEQIRELYETGDLFDSTLDIHTWLAKKYF